MSKAFTKEDDGSVPEPVARRRGVPVPVPNFVTAKGLAAARAELEQIHREGGDADRARELADHLATAEVARVDSVRNIGIGAVVVAEETESGVRHRVQIVGAIEANAKQGLVSWQSPIATAVWGASVGDIVTWPAKGGVEVEIVEVSY